MENQVQSATTPTNIQRYLDSAVKVLDKFGIILKPEVRLIGYRDNLLL